MQENELFKVQLNDAASKIIHKIHKVVIVVFCTSVLVEMLVCIIAVRNYLRFRTVTQDEDLLLYIDIRIYLVYAVIFVFLVLFQIYFLLRFASFAKNSVKLGDSNLFAKALSLLYLNFIFNLAGIIFNGCYFAYYFFKG